MVGTRSREAEALPDPLEQSDSHSCQRGWGQGSLSLSADRSGRSVKVSLAPFPSTWGPSVRLLRAEWQGRWPRASGSPSPSPASPSQSWPKGSEPGAVPLQIRSSIFPSQEASHFCGGTCSSRAFSWPPGPSDQPLHRQTQPSGPLGLPAHRLLQKTPAQCFSQSSCLENRFRLWASCWPRALPVFSSLGS